MKTIRWHERRSIRLKEYDYSSPGEYFVTICTHNHKCIFGEIVRGEMRLNEAGKVAENCWKRIPEHFERVELDEFVVMPNHVHGIIIVRTRHAVSLQRKIERFGKPVSGSLSTIIRSFKSATTKRINEMNSTFETSVWQGRFYERIIRNEKELDRIRDYIANNVLRWEFDSSRETLDKLDI